MNDRTLTVAAYLVLVVAAAGAAVTTWLRPDLIARPGRVVTWAMRRRTTQLGLLLAWWWLGWHFLTSR